MMRIYSEEDDHEEILKKLKNYDSQIIHVARVFQRFAFMGTRREDEFMNDDFDPAPLYVRQALNAHKYRNTFIGSLIGKF